MKKLDNKLNYIIPARLHQARLSRGLSLSELSNKVSVSSQALSQYEIGKTKPSMKVMQEIVDALGFPFDFFKKEINSGNIVKSAVYFRSRKTSPKKIKEALSLKVDFIKDIVDVLEKYVEFIEVNLPNFDDLLDDDEIDFDNIEKIVNRLRKHWKIGFGPIDNMIELLQENGFIISKVEFNNRKVEAFSAWNGRPYIFLGDNKGSAVRSRFDVAHELGHLIMHTNITQDEIRSKVINERMEKEADYFAGAFLMPEETFGKEAVSSSVNYYAMLKKQWKTSISSMLYRADNLKLFTENQIRYLKSQMTSKRYWRAEPYDDIIKFETPDMLKEAIELIIDNGVTTKSDLLREFAFSKDEVESLCFLDNGYFEEDKSIKKINLRVIK
jgi:Zn-dependent peptidase ImmA (M78 family)/DNA-binding XRE family transcriptional regulator